MVTPEGLPPAYEMLPGNTADKTKLSARSNAIWQAVRYVTDSCEWKSVKIRAICG
jgi:hypothetical protein